MGITDAGLSSLLTLSHTHSLQIGSHIKRRVQELGHGCAALVTKAGALQCSPSDAYTKKELIETARKVSEKVGGREVDGEVGGILDSAMYP